jgi:branched-chain amino acid transport system ATP-binding protein
MAAVGEHSESATGPGLLQVDGLTKRFGSFVAVNNVSFAVPEGSVFGIAGPNGAGKSVLFGTVSGFYRPSSGDVIFDGSSIVGHRPHRICHEGLTRTFQTPTLFHSMTVEENLRVGAKFGNAEEGEDLVPGLIEDLELEGVAGRTATNLDLFTTKKVVLGAALATAPRMLLLDEPMAGFSHREVESYRDLIGRLRAKWSITVVIIEHLLDVLIGISDRMLVLHYGEVLFEGDPEEVREHPEVVEVYLGGGPGEEAEPA